MTIRKRFLFLIPVLILLSYALYGHSINAPFYLDDQTVITNNVVVKQAGNIEALFEEFNTRFLVGLSLNLQYAKNGLDVRAYHLFNITLHAVNTFLIFYFCFLLSKLSTRLRPITKNELFLCWFVSLVFFAHPLQTQAVNFIWQRSMLMCTFFMLSACISYIHYIKLKKPLSFFLCLLTSIGAFFSREIAVVLPVLFILIETSFARENERLPKNRWVLIFINCLLIMLIAYLFIRPDRVASEYFVSPQMTQASNASAVDNLTRWSPADKITYKNYALSQTVVFWKYFKLLLVPLGQNVDHDVILRNTLYDPFVLLSVAGILFLMLLFYFCGREYKIFMFGGLWYIVTLSLMLVLPNENMMVEHWLYLPMFGLFLSMGCMIILLMPRIRYRVGFLVLLVGMYSFQTWERNNLWNSQVALWTDAVEKSPRKGTTHDRLAQSYIQEGDYDKALIHLEYAILLDPFEPRTYNNLALVYMAQNNIEEAEAYIGKGLDIKKEDVSLTNNLARLYMQKGQYEEAEELLKKVLKTHQGYVEAYVNLGFLYRQVKEWQKMDVLYAQALNRWPKEGKLYYDWIEGKLIQGDYKGLIGMQDVFNIGELTASDLRLIGNLLMTHSGDNKAFESWLQGRPKSSNTDIFDVLMEKAKPLSSLSNRDQ